MKIELAAQGTQLAAYTAIENRFGHAQRASETGDGAPDGRYFHLRGSIADEIHRAAADAAMHRDPALVNRNARALKFERLEIFLHQKIFQMLSRFRTRDADDAERADLVVFRNEPIKIGRVLRDEPDASGISRHVLRQRHDGLHQRNGFERLPAGGFRHAAGDSVAADDCAGANFFARAVAAAFDFEDQAAAVGMQRMKAAAEFHAGSGFAGFIGESLNQRAALDDEIGILQWESWQSGRR